MVIRVGIPTKNRQEVLCWCFGPPVVHPAYLPPRALTPIDRNSANQVRRDHCSRMWQKTGPGSNIHYWPPIILLVAADRHNNTESDGRAGNGGGNATLRVAIPIQSTQGHKNCQFIYISVNGILHICSSDIPCVLLASYAQILLQFLTIQTQSILQSKWTIEDTRQDIEGDFRCHIGVL